MLDDSVIKAVRVEKREKMAEERSRKAEEMQSAQAFGVWVTPDCRTAGIHDNKAAGAPLRLVRPASLLLLSRPRNQPSFPSIMSGNDTTTYPLEHGDEKHTVENDAGSVRNDDPAKLAAEQEWSVVPALEREIVSKIDRRLLPILGLCYAISLM